MSPSASLSLSLVSLSVCLSLSHTHTHTHWLTYTHPPTHTPLCITLCHTTHTETFDPSLVQSVVHVIYSLRNQSGPSVRDDWLFVLMFSVQFKTKDLIYRRCQLFGYIASLSVEALVELKDSSSQGPESVARRTVDILYTAPPVSVKAQGECQVEDGFRSQSSSLMMDDQSPPAGCPCSRHCQGHGTQRVGSVNTQYTLRTHSVSCQSTPSTHSEHTTSRVSQYPVHTPSTSLRHSSSSCGERCRKAMPVRSVHRVVVGRWKRLPPTQRERCGCWMFHWDWYYPWPWLVVSVALGSVQFPSTLQIQRVSVQATSTL